jgi:hypothetical protein
MANAKSDQLTISMMYGWHVYVLSMPEHSKIGTAARVLVRLASIQNGNPHPLETEAIWHFKSRNEARAVEAMALRTDGLNRIPNRDWCQCSPEIAIAAEAAIGMCGPTANRLQDVFE